MKNNFKRIFGILSIIGLLMLAGCRAKPPEASASARRYDLKGKVVSADKAKMEVVIAHEAIAGYMEPMTMPFTLRDEWVFDVLAPGAAITATLVVDGDRSWLENPTVTQMADAGQPSTEGIEPEVGAEVPDLTLTNQDGRRISLHQYRGRTLILTFIYTRCPLPDYCPLMMRNFAELLPMLPERTELLSISIDPAYDTPAVLRDYGRRHLPPGESFRRWELATGTDEEIRAAAGYFGLGYWQEAGQIIHGLRTAVISPAGRIVSIHRGNEWKPAEIIAELKGQTPVSR